MNLRLPLIALAGVLLPWLAAAQDRGKEAPQPLPVAGDAVVCPLHAWKVNLETGAVARPVDKSECVRTYATRVDEDGVISIEAR